MRRIKLTLPPNMVNIQLFIILLYEDLTVAHSRSYADDVVISISPANQNDPYKQL